MTPPASRPGGTPEGRCVQAVTWRRLESPGTEHCELWESSAGPLLTGTVVLVSEGLPLLVRYTVACDPDWHTREARLVLHQGGTRRTMVLQVDDHQRWWRDGRELPELRGCVDVDLSVTPSTNTLPIRRLGLEVGQAHDVTAAWVRLPDLSLERLEQRYTRLSASLYRYESAGGAFVAEVDTDAQGLVTHYPPGWERVATSEG
ncbi:putative glycolipid-binding domain-containing protein [Corallococcus sp. bb12-1]|uniref:putative glycolipid-binding domain-containing protein n=1 Tax=Corallococcus sp. bb12-1 TaxID=2996784 RepID=UPI00226F821D|nr:putative glycolipid-binding domain-containing protein [Corallococcus sp. bb12-1]MCY1040425.1 putative glycolipid-binding domain-containing protein [Corallococcus sp. bb12-1]